MGFAAMHDVRSDIRKSNMIIKPTNGYAFATWLYEVPFRLYAAGDGEYRFQSKRVEKSIKRRGLSIAL